MKSIDRYIYTLSWYGGVLKHLHNLYLFISSMYHKEGIYEIDYITLEGCKSIFEVEKVYFEEFKNLRQSLLLSETEIEEIINKLVEVNMLDDPTDTSITDAGSIINVYEDKYWFLIDVMNNIDIMQTSSGITTKPKNTGDSFKQMMEKLHEEALVILDALPPIAICMQLLLIAAASDKDSRYFGKSSDELLCLIAYTNQNKNVTVSMIDNMLEKFPGMLGETIVPGKPDVVRQIDVKGTQCFVNLVEYSRSWSFISTGDYLLQIKDENPLQDVCIGKDEFKESFRGVIDTDIFNFLTDHASSGGDKFAGIVYNDIAICSPERKTDSGFYFGDMHCWFFGAKTQEVASCRINFELD